MSTPPNLPEPPKDPQQEPAPSQQPYPPQQPYPYQQPYPPQYGQYAAGGPKTSGLAITGFVLSLLVPLLFWVPIINLIVWLGNLAGFILSIVAVNQIKNSNGQLGGKGLAVAGIVLSCVWFALLLVIVVLVVIAGVALVGNMDSLRELQQFR